MTEGRLADLAARLEQEGLLVRFETPGPAADPAIGAVRYDSRMVAPGDLFVARRGQHADGHDHLAEAVAAGASALIVERAAPDLTVPHLVVGDARAALACAAAWRAGDPSRQLGVIGVTGTDGKTTTAYMVRAILEAAGERTGLISTTTVIVAGQDLGNPARTSTPEAPELQAHLAAMLAGGDSWAVVESTSHGLAQERVGSVAYDVAVLTNITSEHLEFHGTTEAYRAAKLRLFERLAAGSANPDKGWGKHAVINADDPVAEAAADVATRAGASVLRYGLDAERLDLAATASVEDASGMRFSVRAPGWEGEVALRLAGRFNVLNALAALGVSAALELDLEGAARALGGLEAVPGRMQRIDAGQPFSVIVDYAHTADALAKVLDDLAPAAPGAGRIAVFGSAGERDTEKRRTMGEVAGARCRLVVVTDEDPRGEDRLAIIEAIAAGAEAAGSVRGENLLLIPDRAEAIATALAEARTGDVVLLAGKGHERTIEMASGAVDWDEAVAARAALRSLGFG